MVSWLIGSILPSILPYVLGALAIAGVWLGGRSSGKKAVQAAADKEYRKMRKEMDDVESTGSLSADDARKWLHERGK
jgi:hypothetical protein